MEADCAISDRCVRPLGFLGGNSWQSFWFWRRKISGVVDINFRTDRQYGNIIHVCYKRRSSEYPVVGDSESDNEDAAPIWRFSVGKRYAVSFFGGLVSDALRIFFCMKDYIS